MSDELRVPDLPEPIRAYRVWDVDGTTLVSLRGDSTIRWPIDGPLRATCGDAGWRAFVYDDCGRPGCELCGQSSRDVHDCPSHPDIKHQVGKGCGIYALRDVAAMAAMIGPPSPFRPHPRVGGIVELGGRVWPHFGGYRAEYAMPVALYLDDARSEVTDVVTGELWEGQFMALAERYGCDVLPSSELPPPRYPDRQQVVMSWTSSSNNTSMSMRWSTPNTHAWRWQQQLVVSATQYDRLRQVINTASLNGISIAQQSEQARQEVNNMIDALREKARRDREHEQQMQQLDRRRQRFTKGDLT